MRRKISGTDEFVCLASCANTYSVDQEGASAGAGECADAVISRRFLQVRNRLADEPGVLVFTEAGECGEHGGDVSEHYDLAVIDPARIFLRRNLLNEVKTVDFSWLCRLFMREGRFQAYDLHLGGETEAGNFLIGKFVICGCRGSQPTLFYRGRRPGSYGTRPEQYEKLLGELEAEYGEVYPFFQSMIFQDMLPLFLTKEDADREALRRILEKIDDDILCGTGCAEDVLIRILSLKYGEEIEKKFVYRSGRLKYHNLPVVPLKEIPFWILDMKLVKGKFNISGQVLLPLENREIEYYFMDNKNKRYELEWKEDEEIFFLGERLTTRKRFLAAFPVGTKPAGIRFMYRYRNMYQARVRMEFAPELGIVPDTKADFCARDGYLLRAQKRILFLAPLRWKTHLKTRLKLFFTFSGKSIKMV